MRRAVQAGLPLDLADNTLVPEGEPELSWDQALSRIMGHARMMLCD